MAKRTRYRWRNLRDLRCGFAYDYRDDHWRWAWVLHWKHRLERDGDLLMVIGGKPIVSIPLMPWQPVKLKP